MNELISIFESVRDIPYKIPLKWGERDDCCSGKADRLFKTLKAKGFDVRYRVCVFYWNSLKLPKKIEQISHDNDCTHTYLELKLNRMWKILDATWDRNLAKRFYVNNWDGKSDTRIAVKPIKIFTPNKSLRIVKNQDKKLIEGDLKINGNFYDAFNDYLAEIRKTYK